MQEINLLQNKISDTTTKRWEQNNRTVIIVLGLFILAELVVGGLFYMLKKNAEDSKLALDAENVTAQSKLDKLEEQLNGAKGFQAQAQNIDTLLSNHIVWTKLIDDLSESTLKTSRYLSVSSGTDGKMHVEGITPTYTSLGKTLLALNTNEDLASVSLLSSSQSSAGQLGGILYSLEILVKPSVFLTRE